MIYDVVDGGQPAGWEPSQTLDRSAVLSVRYMGIFIAHRPAVDLDQNASDTYRWYVFAVRQAHGTSEWLIAREPGSAISVVEVMSGGPPCASAPDGAACGATP